MTITKEQRDELLEAAKPLMKWLAVNSDPHCKAIVDSCSVEMVQGIASHGTLEFVKD